VQRKVCGLIKGRDLWIDLNDGSAAPGGDMGKLSPKHGRAAIRRHLGSQAASISGIRPTAETPAGGRGVRLQILLNLRRQLINTGIGHWLGLEIVQRLSVRSEPWGISGAANGSLTDDALSPTSDKGHYHIFTREQRTAPLPQQSSILTPLR
jgi:hypothetical protein